MRYLMFMLVVWRSSRVALPIFFSARAERDSVSAMGSEVYHLDWGDETNLL